MNMNLKRNVFFFLKIEVLEYAEYLGIKLPDEGYMIELAREGVKAQLPQHWQACQAQDGELVYRNLITKVVQ